MKETSVVERIRETKREIAKEFDYNIHKFAEHIRIKQGKTNKKLVDTIKVVQEKEMSIR